MRQAELNNYERPLSGCSFNSSQSLSRRKFARAEAAVADRTIRARLTRLSGLHGVFQPAHTLFASSFHLASNANEPVDPKP